MLNFPWILGPCALENEKMFFEIGESLIDIMGDKNWFLKASFDKANRTSISGLRGCGLEKFCDVVNKFRSKHPSVKICTDIHECWQAEKLKDSVDLMQIPAFLCRQTDLLVECGKHFNMVNIKKGQWITPDSTKHLINKVRKENPNAEVWLTERGTMFGYGQLIVDFGAAEELRDYFSNVILDCTHSTQRKKGDYTGGNRTLAEQYLIASLAFKYNGIFAEVHQDPPTAYSDADCQIYLSRLPKLISLYDDLSKTYELYNIWST